MFDTECNLHVVAACLSAFTWLKSGLVLGAGFRPRKRNAKSEPQLSGLTLCVPHSGPDCGLVFGSDAGVIVHLKRGPVIWHVYGRKTRSRRRIETLIHGAVGWYGRFWNGANIVRWW